MGSKFRKKSLKKWNPNLEKKSQKMESKFRTKKSKSIPNLRIEDFYEIQKLLELLEILKIKKKIF